MDHGEVEELVAPLRVTAHRILRCFDQQETQQHVALLADVSQPAPIPTGRLLGNQPDITGDLLPTLKTLESSNHQLVSQCR